MSLESNNPLKDQVNFILNLPENIKNVLIDYTKDLDKYINSLLSKDKYNNLLKRTDEKFKLAKKSIEIIDHLFKMIPRTTKEMVVYRGATNIFKGPYISTSLKDIIGINFMRRSPQNCCLYKIIIPVGSSILPLFPISEYLEEYEILLDRKGILDYTGNDCKVEIEGSMVKYTDQNNEEKEAFIKGYMVKCIELIYHS
jgi:hypothetical protein